MSPVRHQHFPLDFSRPSKTDPPIKHSHGLPRDARSLLVSIMAPSRSSQDREISVASLVRQIESLSSQISAYLASNSYPEPSFSIDKGAVPESPEYEALRAPLNDAALDLLRLINGPKNTLRSLIFSHYDLAALQVALDRRLFDHVPLPSETVSEHDISGATVATVAAGAGIDADRTGRVLKLLATHRIFEEVGGEGSGFKHTAQSALLARDPDFYATADMQMDDMLKAASETSALLRSAPYTSDSVNSAFHERFGVSMYEYYEKNPAKGTRFCTGNEQLVPE